MFSSTAVLCKSSVERYEKEIIIFLMINIIIFTNQSYTDLERNWDKWNAYFLISYFKSYILYDISYIYIARVSDVSVIHGYCFIYTYVDKGYHNNERNS